MFLLIVFLLLSSLGVLAWFISISPFFVYAGSTVLASLFILLLLKKMAKWAVTSMIAWTILASLISYKMTSHMVRRDMQFAPQSPNVYQDDFADMLSALKRQGFPAKLAREAADYAIHQIPDDPLEEKLRTALQYLGDEQQPLITGGRK